VQQWIHCELLTVVTSNFLSGQPLWSPLTEAGYSCCWYCCTVGTNLNKSDVQRSLFLFFFCMQASEEAPAVAVNLPRRYYRRACEFAHLPSSTPHVLIRRPSSMLPNTGWWEGSLNLTHCPTTSHSGSQPGSPITSQRKGLVRGEHFA